MALSSSYLKYLPQPILREVLFLLDADDIIKYCETYDEGVCRSDQFWSDRLQHRYPLFHAKVVDKDLLFNQIDQAKIAEQGLTGVIIQLSGHEVYYRIDKLSDWYIKGIMMAYELALKYEKHMQVLHPTGDLFDTDGVNDYDMIANLVLTHSVLYRNLQAMSGGSQRPYPSGGFWATIIVTDESEGKISEDRYMGINEDFVDGFQDVVKFFGLKGHIRDIRPKSEK